MLRGIIWGGLVEASGFWVSRWSWPVLEGQDLRSWPGRPQIPQERLLRFVGRLLMSSLSAEDICGRRTVVSSVGNDFDGDAFFDNRCACVDPSKKVLEGF